MSSELGEEAADGPDNAVERTVVTRRYNRGLLLLMWGFWAVSCAVLAWGWLARGDDYLSLLGYGWAVLALLGILTLLLCWREEFVVDEIGLHRRGVPVKTDPTPWTKVERIRRDTADQKKGRVRFELKTLVPKASPPRIDISCTDAQYRQILKLSA